MTNNSNEKDILALEAMSELKNYNSYTFKLIADSITSKKVLDFGSGYGVFCEYLQDKNYDVQGYEINQLAIDESKSRGIEVFSNLLAIKEKYETITSLNVLEHIEDDEAVINEIKSLLTKNGTLVVYLPASKIAWSQMDEDVNHYRRYSKKELQQKLIKANFEIEQTRFVDFIGWLVLLILKLFRIKPKFNKRLLIFYDKVFFKIFRNLDVIFKYVVGKNLLVVARLKN
tara:strand:- start:849 stop:1535 length:687 start_codon:yes stop_codon:yes gene_type:complete